METEPLPDTDSDCTALVEAEVLLDDVAVAGREEVSDGAAEAESAPAPLADADALEDALALALDVADTLADALALALADADADADALADWLAACDALALAVALALVLGVHSALQATRQSQVAGHRPAPQRFVHTARPLATSARAAAPPPASASSDAPRARRLVNAAPPHAYGAVCVPQFVATAAQTSAQAGHGDGDAEADDDGDSVAVAVSEGVAAAVCVTDGDAVAVRVTDGDAVGDDEQTAFMQQAARPFQLHAVFLRPLWYEVHSCEASCMGCVASHSAWPAALSRNAVDAPLVKAQPAHVRPPLARPGLYDPLTPTSTSPVHCSWCAELRPPQAPLTLLASYASLALAKETRSHALPSAWQAARAADWLLCGPR